MSISHVSSSLSKARLSNVVEAKIDCAVAMDILSFALYHENTEMIETPMVILHGDKRPAVSDESDMEEDDENDSKRQRLDNATKVHLQFKLVFGMSSPRVVEDKS